MAYVKLTKYDRSQILDRMLKFRFGPLEDQIKKQREDLAEVIYRSLYTESELDTLEMLGEDWFYTADSVNVNLGGQYHVFDLKTPRPVKYGHIRNRVMASHAANHPISVAADRINRDHSKMYEESQQVRRMIIAALDSYTSVGTMLKEWPEVAPFVKGQTPAVAVSTDLVVKTTEINERLGLPVLPSMLEPEDRATLVEEDAA